MKKLIKQEKGVTIVSVAIAIIVILIITTMLAYNAKDTVYIKSLTNLYNDIEAIKDKISTYYAQYGDIPAKIEYELPENWGGNEFIGKNDIGDEENPTGFYVIDLKELYGLTLNFGKDYEKIGNEINPVDNKIKGNETHDLYIINKNSHNIFYVKGIKVPSNNETKMYYTDEENIDEVEVALQEKPNIGIVDGVTIPDEYKAVNLTAKKEEGIVIKDKNENEFVWIPVPKTEEVYKTAKLEITTFTQEEYEAIDKDLRDYSSTFAYNYTDDQDQWYAVEDDQTIVTHDKEGLKENQKKLTTGCGLNYYDYYELKKKMLKSIYQNGGFWIGRYEAGVEEPRTSSNTGTMSALSQPNKYPYNYVTVSQAQELASEMPTSGGLTSSLMFGVQWNLVCKFLSTILEENEVKVNSGTWANYYDVTFKIDRGEYCYQSGSLQWKSITEDTENVKNKEKISNKGVLLTTGASDRNCKLNIYDFAGNVGEMTREKYITSDTDPCSYRGGSYHDTSFHTYSASRRNSVSAEQRIHKSFVPRITLLVRLDSRVVELNL